MPVSILVSQSPRQDPQRRDFEEEVVTLLLMEDGLEVHVVPHLEQLHDDDTGRLCLEGLTAHIIALSWMAPSAAFKEMQRLGAPGRFGRTNHEKETPPELADIAHPRTIYNLDLARFESTDQCRKEIKRIIDEQSVQVVSIGLGGGPGIGAPSGTPSRPKTVPLENTPATSPPEPEQPKPTGEAVDWDDDDQLDRLVDELDDLDI